MNITLRLTGYIGNEWAASGGQRCACVPSCSSFLTLWGRKTTHPRQVFAPHCFLLQVASGPYASAHKTDLPATARENHAVHTDTVPRAVAHLGRTRGTAPTRAMQFRARAVTSATPPGTVIRDAARLRKFRARQCGWRTPRTPQDKTHASTTGHVAAATRRRRRARRLMPCPAPRPQLTFGSSAPRR
jgi:hypothetical protein